MQFRSVVLWVLGSSLVTLVLAVSISTKFIILTPKNLASVIKEDPVSFLDAIKEASEVYKGTMMKRAQMEEEERIKEELKNPNTINTKGRVTFGPKESAVTIVEFSDFQCPFCANASKQLNSLVEKYKGKVNVVYKHFPLNFHAFAMPAAVHFEALALIDHKEAKKFHDEIFDNFNKYAKLNSEKDISKAIRAIVRKLNVSYSSVKSNLKKAEEVVKADMAEASKLQVRGTPTFFVNGVKSGRDLNKMIQMFLDKK